MNSQVYIPIQKGLKKAHIRGLWQSKTLAYDYIQIKPFKGLNRLKLAQIKKQYNQEAIFFEKGKKAYCYYNNMKVEKFTKKLKFRISKSNRANLKNTMKFLLKKYGGLTVSISKKYYNISIWIN